MVLSYWTDMPGQTLKTHIRQLIEEQSDQGMHCLLFILHIRKHFSPVKLNV